MTGGIRGGLVGLELSQTRYSTPQLEWGSLQLFCSPMEVRQVWKVNSGRRSINHLDCDTSRVLIGTDTDMQLWQVVILPTKFKYFTAVDGDAKYT